LEGKESRVKSEYFYSIKIIDYQTMEKMANFSIFLPLMAGALIAAQISLETKSRESYGALPVAFFAFGLAFIICLSWACWVGINPFAIRSIQFSQVFGGLSRFLYLLLMTAPAVGLANTDKMCFVVVGQILVGTLIEHFGWFGIKPCKVDWQTFLGIAGLIFSAVLILKRPCL
jgi:bacterial/archaeal transporter family-2 protein